MVRSSEDRGQPYPLFRVFRVFRGKNLPRTGRSRILRDKLGACPAKGGEAAVPPWTASCKSCYPVKIICVLCSLTRNDLRPLRIKTCTIKER